MKTINNGTLRFLRDKQVAAMLSVSRSYVWRLVKMGILPTPIRLGAKFTVWRSSDIEKIVERPEIYFRNKG